MKSLCDVLSFLLNGSVVVLMVGQPWRAVIIQISMKSFDSQIQDKKYFFLIRHMKGLTEDIKIVSSNDFFSL